MNILLIAVIVPFMTLTTPTPTTQEQPMQTVKELQDWAWVHPTFTPLNQWTTVQKTRETVLIEMFECVPPRRKFK